MIGNGSTMHATPLFSTADDETIDRLNSLLPVRVTSKKCGDFCYRISGAAGNGENVFMSALRELGMTGKRAEEKESRMFIYPLAAARASNFFVD